MKKKSILDLYKMKQNGEKATWITAYDAPFASFAEQAGIDMILVGDSEVERLRELRIAAQELVGMHYDGLAAGLPRLVADMTFPRHSFRDTAALYQEDAAEAGIGCCVYGHILTNHLTASLLPEDAAQHAWAVAMLRRWAKIALDQGGETAGAYGIGSLKRQLLEGLLPEEKLERCRRVTEQLAPQRTWNRAAVL